MYKDKFIRLYVEKMKILVKGSIFIATGSWLFLEKDDISEFICNLSIS